MIINNRLLPNSTIWINRNKSSPMSKNSSSEEVIFTQPRRQNPPSKVNSMRKSKRISWGRESRDKKKKRNKLHSWRRSRIMESLLRMSIFHRGVTRRPKRYKIILSKLKSTIKERYRWKINMMNMRTFTDQHRNDFSYNYFGSIWWVIHILRFNPKIINIIFTK